MCTPAHDEDEDFVESPDEDESTTRVARLAYPEQRQELKEELIDIVLGRGASWTLSQLQPLRAKSIALEVQLGITAQEIRSSPEYVEDLLEASLKEWDCQVTALRASLATLRLSRVPAPPGVALVPECLKGTSGPQPDVDDEHERFGDEEVDELPGLHDFEGADHTQRRSARDLASTAPGCLVAVADEGGVNEPPQEQQEQQRNRQQQQQHDQRQQQVVRKEHVEPWHAYHYRDQRWMAALAQRASAPRRDAGRCCSVQRMRTGRASHEASFDDVLILTQEEVAREQSPRPEPSAPQEQLPAPVPAPSVPAACDVLGEDAPLSTPLPALGALPRTRQTSGDEPQVARGRSMNRHRSAPGSHSDGDDEVTSGRSGSWQRRSVVRPPERNSFQAADRERPALATEAASANEPLQVRKLLPIAAPPAMVAGAKLVGSPSESTFTTAQDSPRPVEEATKELLKVRRLPCASSPSDCTFATAASVALESGSMAEEEVPAELLANFQQSAADRAAETCAGDHRGVPRLDSRAIAPPIRVRPLSQRIRPLRPERIAPLGMEPRRVANLSTSSSMTSLTAPAAVACQVASEASLSSEAGPAIDAAVDRVFLGAPQDFESGGLQEHRRGSSEVPRSRWAQGKELHMQSDAALGFVVGCRALA